MFLFIEVCTSGGWSYEIEVLNKLTSVRICDGFLFFTNLAICEITGIITVYCISAHRKCLDILRTKA